MGANLCKLKYIFSRRNYFEQQGPDIDVELEKYDFKSLDRSDLSLQKTTSILLIQPTVNVEMMENMYSKQKEEMGMNYILDPDILRSAEKSLIILRTHCEEYYSHLMNQFYEVDSNFLSKFKDVSEDRRDECFVKHFIMFTFIVLKIVRLCEDEQMEVFNLFKQITIAHSLRHINVNDFNLIFEFCMNFLIQQNLIEEDDRKPLILFFMTITSYIRKFIKMNLKSHVKTDGNERESSNFRKNYRLRKKWDHLVKDLDLLMSNFDRVISDVSRAKSLVVLNTPTVSFISTKSTIFNKLANFLRSIKIKV